MINVTKTYLPPRERLLALVDGIYERGWVTNRGPLVLELERRLQAHLGVPHVVLVANGTVAMEVAYRALGLTGEVVTTPFSFVATTSSLVATGLTPVFADIDPHTWNIDPAEVERRITPRTRAILPVHVFGSPCATEALEAIGRAHGIPVIYDAAHAFGVARGERSVLEHGAVSTLSFHATKTFHTIEGGAIVTADAELAARARLLINFGIDGPESVASFGINAKMNELEAAMGLCVLEDLEERTRRRTAIHDHYMREIGDRVTWQRRDPAWSSNHGYMPALFRSEADALDVQRCLKAEDISPRRYFYPSLDTLPYLPAGPVMRVSRDVASRILCLPIYPELADADVERIIRIVRKGA
jgi:dTDP-4-amino-4,6-dideoxygalactose transaminase